MEVNFGLRLPREVATVPIVRRLCQTTMTRLQVEPDCVDDVALAVTEACANVIDHASGAGDEYEVRVQIDGDVVEIRVIDAGRGFDADRLGRAMPGETADRGRGIQLMRALVDRISFESKPEEGTVVHFEKRLQLAERSPLHALRDGFRS
jgi:serine/threonine-protein kinase RsbW